MLQYVRVDADQIGWIVHLCCLIVVFALIVCFDNCCVVGLFVVLFDRDSVCCLIVLCCDFVCLCRCDIIVCFIGCLLAILLACFLAWSGLLGLFVSFFVCLVCLLVGLEALVWWGWVVLVGFGWLLGCFCFCVFRLAGLFE